MSRRLIYPISFFEYLQLNKVIAQTFIILASAALEICFSEKCSAKNSNIVCIRSMYGIRSDCLYRVLARMPECSIA